MTSHAQLLEPWESLLSTSADSLMIDPQPGVAPACNLRQPARSRVSAFTLVEMLTVMAIAGILVGLSSFAVTSVISSHTVASDTYNVASFLELARNEAVGRQTYVWVGVSNVANGSNSPSIVLAAVSSIDGSTNDAPTNLTQVAAPLHISGVALRGWSALKPATQSLFTGGTPQNLADNTTGISFTAGTAAFTGATLTFTPRGEAMLKGVPADTDGYTPFIDLSFLEAHGAAVTNQDDAAVVVDGATGNPSIIRLP